MGKHALVIAGAIIVVVLLLTLVGGGMMGVGMMGGSGFGMGWAMGMGTGWIVVMILFWALVVGGLVWLLVSLFGAARSRADSRAEQPRPLDILRERYARGDITREEYERMREDLAEPGGDASRPK